MIKVECHAFRVYVEHDYIRYTADTNVSFYKENEDVIINDIEITRIEREDGEELILWSLPDGLEEAIIEKVKEDF